MSDAAMASDLTGLFITLSDGTRLRLLRLMFAGEVSVGYLADELGESQPKISRHLAFMRDHGIVSTRRDGKHIYYSIAPASSTAEQILRLATGGTERPVKTGSYEHITQNEYVPDELPVFLL